MLCERCQQRDATVFFTTCHCNVDNPDETTTTSGPNLCRECFERDMPDKSMQWHLELEKGCSFCGRKCGESICRRCRLEAGRFSREIGLHFSGEKRTREDRHERMRLMNALTEHMKQWVAETRPDLQDEPEGSDNPDFSPDAVYERLAEADSQFQIGAYQLVRRAVREASATGPGPNAHVSGREVALAFRALAIREFGRDAFSTLSGWGLYTTDDIGAVVFQMIAAGLLGAQPEDRLEDFHAIYNFAEAFPRD